MGVALILGLGGLAWWLIFRSWMMQGDDFMSATIGGARGGRFTLQAWAQDSWRDYWQATGRQAGSLFRIFLRGGPEVMRWVMPAQQVLVAASLLVWSRSSAAPVLVRWGFALTAVCAVPILAWRTPDLHGAALVWAQSSFDYVVSPAFCLLLVGCLLATPATGWTMPLTVALSVVAVVAPLLHETGSIAVLASVVVMALSGRHRPTGRARLVMALATLAALVQVTSPGLWKRLGAVTEVQPAEAGGRLMLLRAANVSWQAGASIGAVVLLASGLLVLAGLTSGRRPLLLAGALHTAAMVVVVLAQQRWGRWTELTSYSVAMSPEQFRWAALLVGAAALAALSALLITLGLVGELGTGPLVALAGAAGSFVAPLLAGATTMRAILPLALWLVAVIFSLLGAWANHTSVAPRRLAAGAVAAALVLACWAVPLWWWRTWTGMRENAAVHAPVLAQLEQARLGQRTEVTFPRSYPHPELMYYYAFRLDRYGPMITLYHDLPAGVNLVREP